MGTKVGFIVGAVAASIFATTPQGRKIVESGKTRVERLWQQPKVQAKISKVQDTVLDSD